MKKGDRIVYMKFPVYSRSGNVLYYLVSKPGVFIRYTTTNRNYVVLLDGEKKLRRVTSDRIELEPGKQNC